MDQDDSDNLSAPASMADSFERMLAEPADALAIPLTVGTLVAGRYEVIERIGAGAMGMVYLATDRDLERKIALKLHKKRAGTEQLRREALAMARLAHPNVVTVFEVGEHEGRTFVAMEYVAGTTLRGWLAEQRRTPAEILDVLLAAAEGLIAAHDAKLVHRDFKPENVLIGRDGRARVSDFGLARETGHEIAAAASAIGASTGVAGTPAYMAPEQSLGISVDARADQYAFCGVAWEALVGRWPRDDKPTKQPRLRRVLERGLSRDPAQRFPTMRALLAALRAARSRGHLLLGAVAIALLIVAFAVTFAVNTSKEEVAASCEAAGIEIVPFALDVPARVSTHAPAVTVEIVEQRLASYRASYIATAKAVCTNGLIDRTWSQDLYRRGVNCLGLHRRMMEISFDSTRRSTAPELIDRVARLQAETACGDPTVLASRPAMPDAPAVVEEIIRVRAALEAAVADNSSTRQQRLTDALALAEASSVKDQSTVAPRIDLGRAMFARGQGNIKESEALLTKSYFAARAIDDPDLALAALVALINSTSSRYQDPALANWLANAEADAQRARTRAPVAAARLYIAAAATNDGYGDPKKSLVWLREAIALLGDTPSRALADALMIRASVHLTDGQPEPAYADYLRAIAMFEALYGPAHKSLAKIKLSASAGMTAMNKQKEANRLATEGEAILDLDPSIASHDVAQMKINIASNHINNRNFAKARKTLAEAREITLRVKGPDDPDLALIDSSVAYIFNEEKDYATAKRLADEALVLMDRTTPKPHDDRGQLYTVQSDAARGLGDLETSITAAEAAAREYPEGDERKLRALVAAARGANENKQPARALAIIAKIRALPPATDAIELGRIELEHGRALVAQGTDRAAATNTLDGARAIFEKAKAADWIQQVDAARAKLR